MNVHYQVRQMIEKENTDFSVLFSMAEQCRIFPNLLEVLRAHGEVRSVPEEVVFCRYIPFRSYFDSLDEAIEEGGFRLGIGDIVGGQLLHGESYLILGKALGIQR